MYFLQEGRRAPYWSCCANDGTGLWDLTQDFAGNLDGGKGPQNAIQEYQQQPGNLTTARTQECEVS